MTESAFYASGVFWLFFFSWLPYMLVVVIYGFGSPWWTTAIGRSLLLTKVVIVAILTNVLAWFILDNLWLYEQIRTALMVLVPVAGFYQLFAILRIQRKHRHDQRERATVTPPERDEESV